MSPSNRGRDQKGSKVNRTIWKYPIAIGDATMVKMPIGAKVLCAQMQYDDLTLWAEVDGDQMTEIRHFRVFGTGGRMPYDMGYSDVYVGTVQHVGYVWHVYELTGI